MAIAPLENRIREVMRAQLSLITTQDSLIVR
jgi:hypothetical protein